MASILFHMPAHQVYIHVCVPNKDRPMSTLLGAMVGVWMWAHRNNGVWALFEHSVTSQLTNYGVWGPYHEKETGYGTFDNRNWQNGCHSPCVTILSQVSKLCIWVIYASKNGKKKSGGHTRISKMTVSWALTFYLLEVFMTHATWHRMTNYASYPFFLTSLCCH